MQLDQTGAYIIAEQFHNLKFGDRFYFENQGTTNYTLLTPGELLIWEEAGFEPASLAYRANALTTRPHVHIQTPQRDVQVPRALYSRLAPPDTCRGTRGRGLASPFLSFCGGRCENLASHQYTLSVVAM